MAYSEVKPVAVRHADEMRKPMLFVVFWSLAASAQKISHDLSDATIEDLMQIEVTSGATLWGANAVNGVINIITKSAADTKVVW